MTSARGPESHLLSVQMDHNKPKEMFFKFQYRLFCLAVLIFCNRQMNIQDGTYGGDEKCTQFLWRTLKERGCLEDVMLVPPGYADYVSYFSEVLSFLRDYSWVFNFPVTELLVRDVFKQIPKDWSMALLSLNNQQLNSLPKGFVMDDWPPSLVHFCHQCQALKIPIQRVINHAPQLPDKVRRGLTPKKQHEVMTLATFINAECNKYGITEVLDMGAGLGYLGQLLHHWYGYHVLGLEVEAERVRRAARRQADLCPSSAVKYLTLSISSESYLLIENEILNSIHRKSNNNCTCGTSNIQSHQCSAVTKKPLPEMCINGCEMAGYQSEARNTSSPVCSAEHSNVQGICSQSLSANNGLFGATNIQVCMTGLHACGDLTVEAIRLFFQLASVKLLVIVPCCYHKMSLAKNIAVMEEKFCNFPLSSSLYHLVHSAAFCDAVCFLRRPFLRLASQETATRWQQWSEEDHKQHSLQVMARAVLELYAHNEDLVLKKKRRHGVRKTNRSTFDSFMDDALKRYEFVARTNESHYDNSTILCQVAELWHHYKASCHAAEIVTVLQMAVQGVAESFVLADRAAYLQEHAVSSVDIVQVMDDYVSPRCLALVARK